jgi:MoaA/NifB/PqqE/SkfB family radical SAM enzyme
MNLFDKILTGSRVAGKILYSKATSKRIPVVANLLINNDCNIKCFYCFPQVFKREVKQFTTQELIKLIDDFYDRGTEVMVLLGGEPLLRNDIGEIVRYVKSKKMICEVITNGYLVEHKINEIKGIDSLCVSIDGDEESNDKNREKGSYLEALNAIRIAKENGVNVRIHSVLTKYTYDSLEHLMELAKDLGVQVNYSQATIHTEHEALEMTDGELKKFWKKLIKFKKAGYPVGNSFKTLEYVLNWPYSYNDLVYNVDGKKEIHSYDYVPSKNGKIPEMALKKNNSNGSSSICKDFKLQPCQRTQMSAYVDAEGSFYPCGVVWDKSGVSARDVGFDGAWDHLKTINCTSCANVSEVELNQLLNFNIAEIFEKARYLIKSHFGRC